MNSCDSFLEMLKRARFEQEPVAVFDSSIEPPSLKAGYDCQDRLHTLLTPELGDLAGYKIGCTTPVMQEYMGIPHPCAGGVFRQTIYTESATVSHAAFIKPGVECEIAVHISRDMPVGSPALSWEEVSKYVQSCCVSIEIVDDRYQDYTSLSIPTLIADDLFNASVVLGKPRMDWQSLDLATINGTMTINGENVGEGQGKLILGHPMKALTWLIEHLNARGTSLKAGEFVTLGSVVKTAWITNPQTEVVIEFEGLGRASVRFV